MSAWITDPKLLKKLYDIVPFTSGRRLYQEVYDKILIAGVEFTADKKDEMQENYELLYKILDVHAEYTERAPFGDLFGGQPRRSRRRPEPPWGWSSSWGRWPDGRFPSSSRWSPSPRRRSLMKMTEKLVVLGTWRITAYMTRDARKWHGEEIMAKIQELDDIIRSAETGATLPWRATPRSILFHSRPLET